MQPGMQQPGMQPAPQQQAGPWQPAPMPGQPVPVGPQPAAPPSTMPYEPGQPVPAGYHVETRANLGLTIAGFSQAGAMWMLTALIGLSFADETDSPEMYQLAIPIMGPFLLFDDADGDFGALLDMLLGLSAGVQVIGTILGVIGLSSSKEILVRDAVVARVEPVIGPGQAGLRVVF
jgi:hypothetical protein